VILVTGAGGHIGQRLTMRLAADGFAVRALVRKELEWPSGVEQVVGDLVADPGLAKELAADVVTAVHLAGASEASLAHDTDRTLADSVLAAERVAQSGVARVIYLSTVHVYGAALAPGAEIDETTPTAPLTAYASARLACEERLHASDTPTMVLRLTNGIGAPLRPDSPGWKVVTHELCKEGALSGRLTLRTPGVQWRDFVPLVDVETALSTLLGSTSFRAGTFNFASGTSVTVRDLAHEVQDSFTRLTGQQPELNIPPAPSEHPGPYRVRTDALDDLALFTPTPRGEALDSVVRFCLGHRDALASAT
jgi:UDP-glucose 4-epimerase